MWSGAATCSRVSPLCPFWPPEGLFDGPRRLLVRAARGGFLSPSLDGGLPLLELFNPSRRSSSARRDFRAAISAAWAATSVISSSCDGSKRESGSFIESLNRNPIPLSRKIYPRSLQRNLSTWAVTVNHMIYEKCAPPKEWQGAKKG